MSYMREAEATLWSPRRWRVSAEEHLRNKVEMGSRELGSMDCTLCSLGMVFQVGRVWIGRMVDAKGQPHQGFLFVGNQRTYKVAPSLLE